MAGAAPQVINTNVDFATAVENDLGVANPTTNEIDNILRWMTAEEPSSHWWNRNNPLNNGLGSGGGAGLGSYPNLATAAQEVANNLTGGSPSFGYGPIATDLRTDATPQQFSADVTRSSWAESRYGVAAAGAPAKWVVPGRGLDYLATLPVPGVVGGGDSSSAAPGAAATKAVSGQGGSAASTAGSTNANLVLDWNPLNGFGIPGDIIGGIEHLFSGGVAQAGGGVIASALLGVIDVITRPLKIFLEDAALVIIGLIAIVVGLVVAAHAISDDRGGGAAPLGAGGRGEGAKREGGEGTADEAAEAAAV